MAIGSIRSLAYGRQAPFSAFASTPAHCDARLVNAQDDALKQYYAVIVIGSYTAINPHVNYASAYCQLVLGEGRP